MQTKRNGKIEMVYRERHSFDEAWIDEIGRGERKASDIGMIGVVLERDVKMSKRQKQVSGK